MLRRWIRPLTVGAQLAIAAAPHPFGVAHKKPLTLFTPPTAVTEPGTTPKSKVVCGTVLVEADPRGDPKMTRGPRTDATFSIRTYPRPACGNGAGVGSPPTR